MHHPDVTLSGQFSEYFPTCHDQFDGLGLSPKRGVAPGPRPPRWAPHSNPKGRTLSLKIADSSFNLEIQYVFGPPVTLPLAGYVACIQSKILLRNRFGEGLLLNRRVLVERENVAMSRPSGPTHAEVHTDASHPAMLKMASTEICSARCPRLRRSEYLPWNLGNRSGPLACFRDRHTCLTAAYAVALLPSACASRFCVIR